MSRRKGPTPPRQWQPLEPATWAHQGVEIENPYGPERSIWKNDVYTVIRHRMDSTVKDNPEPMIYLSIRRNDRKPARDWRDFQRIKNQLAGPHYEGVELYPAESRKVDEANQYHLWCFPFQLPFGFNERVVRTQALNDEEGSAPGAVQRDPEPVDLEHGGLTLEQPGHPTVRLMTKEQADQARAG